MHGVSAKGRQKDLWEATLGKVPVKKQRNTNMQVIYRRVQETQVETAGNKKREKKIKN